MFNRILAANDGSEGAFKAFTVALNLTRHYRSDLHMIMVEELPRFPGSIDEVVEEKEEADHRFGDVIERARSLAKMQRLRFQHHVVVGHPVPTIVEFAKERGFDLIVIGFMGHSAIYERIIGGTADRIVRLAPCTVLVVK